MDNIISNGFDRSKLVDISSVVIDVKKPKDERIRDYIAQIGTPYRYLDGGVVVELGFADTPVTLQERLLSYLNGMEGAGNLR